MGRRSSGPKAKKRKKVLVTPAERLHGKELTEPYRLMESLVNDYRPDLQEAKIEILWRSGWRADADGWVQMVNVKKAGDVDKALSVKADYAMLLNKENFPRLTERLKTIYLHHALCHMKPMIDSDGEQKQDDKGRKIWRIVKRHDVEQFSDIVKTYGPDALNLDAEAKAAINDSQRPLLAAAERGDGNGKTTEPAAERAGDVKLGDNESTPAGTADASGTDKTSWRRMKIAALEMPASVEQFVIDSGKKTLGALADYMAEKGDFWDRDLQVGGQRKPPRFRATIEDAWAEFWAEHKEFCAA